MEDRVELLEYAHTFSCKLTPPVEISKTLSREGTQILLQLYDDMWRYFSKVIDVSAIADIEKLISQIESVASLDILYPQEP